MAKKNNVSKAIVIREKLRVAVPKKKRVKNARKRPNVMTRGLVGGPGTHNLAMSVMNPFTNSACMPDGSRGTGCFTTRELLSFTTGTAGTAGCIALCPQTTSAMYYLDSGSLVGTYTISGNWAQSSQATTVNALYKSIRACSAGIRCTYVGNTINDQGVFTGGQLAEGFALSLLTGGTLSSVNANAQYLRSEPLRNGFEIFWVPEDIVNYSEWTLAAAGTTTVGTTRASPTLFVGFDKVATNGNCAVNIEIIINWEGQFFTNALLAGGSSSIPHTPAEPGWYENLQNIIGSVRPYGEAVGNMAVALGGPLVGSAVNGAMRTLGPLANGYGQSIAMGMLNGYSGSRQLLLQ